MLWNLMACLGLASTVITLAVVGAIVIGVWKDGKAKVQAQEASHG